MQLFRPEAPSLGEFIISNKHFSLEAIQGINGQRRPISKDFAEALEEARVIEVSNYIKSFELKDGELAKLLSDENKSIDSIQKGWLRKSLSEAIEKNNLDDDLKKHLQIGLIATKPNTNINKGVFNFEENLGDPIAKQVFNLNSPTIHHQAASLIVSELVEIAKLPEDKNGNEINPRSERIASLLKLTNTKKLQEVFEIISLACDLENIDQHNEHGLNTEESIHGFASKQIEKLQQALMAFPEIKRSLDKEEFVSNFAIASKKGDSELKLPKLSKGSLKSAETILGGLKSDDQMNLNFQNNIDFAAESKRLIQKLGISIDTEHCRFGRGGKFHENVGGEKFIEKDVESNGRFKSTLKKVTSFIKGSEKPNQQPNKDKVDWTESDYSWHKKDIHFDTENTKPIKKVSFKDNAGKPIFIQKPEGSFGNIGGMILFAKGREIKRDEAKLMVAQFMRTCRTGSMFITPPAHLGSPEKTARHVRLIMESALELGLAIESIHIRPNGMLKAEDIERMKQEISMKYDAQPLNEFGGLSDSAMLAEDSNDLENVVTVENKVEKNDSPNNKQEPEPETNNKKQSKNGREIIEKARAKHGTSRGR